MRISVLEEGTRSVLEVDRPIVRIGRAADNDVRLQSAHASRHHCRLVVEPDGTYVVDLGSSNGTEVNGERIARQLLCGGDVIAIGGTELRVEDLSGPSDTLQGDAGPAATAALAHPTRDDLKTFARITRALARETEAWYEGT